MSQKKEVDVCYVFDFFFSQVPPNAYIMVSPLLGMWHGLSYGPVNGMNLILHILNSDQWERNGER